MKYSSLAILLLITMLTLIKSDQLNSEQVVIKTNIKSQPSKRQFHSHVHAHIIPTQTHAHVHRHSVHPVIHRHLANPHSRLHVYPVHTHTSLKSDAIHLYTLFGRRYIDIAKLAYCDKKFILAKSCIVCPTILKTHKTYFIHSINENKKRLFQFVIVYSDVKKEVIVSFSGPKTTQVKYFTKVYKKGFKKIAILGNLKVEQYFWEIYSKYMREVLIKKVKKVISSKRGNYKFVFVGHSFGGSISILAAYDLVKNKIIKSNKKLSNPIVYTYGLMRIGDNKFVNKVNELLKVIRISRSDDFVTRVPSCVYDSSSKLFKCYKRVSKVIKHYPVFKRYFVVYRRGLGFYRRTITKRSHVTHQHTVNPHVRLHSHYHAYYSQPFGTLIHYTRNNFSSYNVCKYVNGIPVCEKGVKLPSTFSPAVHSHYYGVDVEMC